MRKILFLTWMVVLASAQSLFAQINSGNPAKPFGSNTGYQYGIMPTNLPASGTYGKSQAAADAYDAWKTKYVAECSNGQYRVRFDDVNQTVSEGIAYGMLLTAYAGDKVIFDGLWKYYQANTNGNGVMNWKINGCSGVIGANGATDAELDAAMALIIASVQWPSGNYKADANKLIQTIRTHEMMDNGHVKPGDAWNDRKNPGYYPPAYFREYAKVNTANASFWNTTAINAANDMLLTNRNATTGLVSEWANENGTVNGGNTYGYEGIRNVWRMTTDYIWNGPAVATTAADICGKVAAHIKGDEANLKVPCGTGSKLSSGSDKNGTAYMTALAPMGSTEQNSLNLLYAELSNAQKFNNEPYYSATLRCITLFVMTGNFWAPDATMPPPPPPCTNDVTVTFDTDGGSNVLSETVCAGEKATRPANPTKTGASFAGWFITGSATEFDFENTSINENITLHAQWSVATATLTLDANQGLVSPANITVNQGERLGTLPVPTREGFGFAGWYSQPEGGQEYTENSILNEDATAYARWTTASATVTFDTQNGNGGSTSVTATYNAAMPQAQAPMRNGYAFDGYYSEINGEGTQYYNNNMQSVKNCDFTSDITLYANWIANTYTITLQSENNVSTTVTAIYGSVLPAAEAPVRDGYIFDGYYGGSNGNGTQYYNAEMEGVAEWDLTYNASIYANWIPESYTITYHVNGGEEIPEGTYNAITPVTLPNNIKREGYEFAGWYESADFTGNQINNINYGSTGNKEFYAKWNPIRYTIIYQLDGGQNAPENPVSYTIEDHIVLQDPTKQGFEFDGWLEGNEIQAGSTSNKTFTATWRMITGISENSSVAALQIYPNPTKSGNFHVTLPDNEPAVLSIFNQQGQLIYSTTVNNGLVSINTNLDAGIYLISIQSKNGIERQKLIVK